jgi:hypothetical protein
MSGDAELMLMVAGMHMLGLVCAAALIVPALRNGDELPPRNDLDSDDGWGHGPLPPPSPSGTPRGGLPLPDAEPAAVRLRDHRRLGDLLPRRERRPAREPGREPLREPVAPGR